MPHAQPEAERRIGCDARIGHLRRRGVLVGYARDPVHPRPSIAAELLQVVGVGAVGRILPAADAILEGVEGIDQLRHVGLDDRRRA